MSTAEPKREAIPKRSLVWEWSIFACLLLVLTGASLSWIGYAWARRILREQTYQRLRIVADNRSEMLGEYVARQKERARSIASRARLRTLLDEYVRGNVDASTLQRTASEVLQDTLDRGKSFRALCLLSRHGRVLATTGQQHQGRDYSHSIAFQRCQDQLTRDRCYFGEPFLDDDDRLVAHLTVLLTNQQQQPLGVILVVLHLRQIQGLLGKTLRDHLGASGRLFVAFQGEHGTRYLLPEDHAGQQGGRGADAAGITKAIDGQAGFGTVSFANGPALSYHRPAAVDSGQRNWGMLVTVDADAAYQPLAKLRYTFVGVQGGLLLLGMLATAWWARSFTKPIQALTVAAQSLASANLSARVPARRRHDELGALVTAFNQAATRLDDLHAELEQQVAASSAELDSARDEAEAAHRALESKAAELERSNNDLQQFAYVASHDLQEPLRAVTGFTELLQNQYADKLDEQANKFITFAVDGARRMSTMINNLLDYSRVGTRTQEFSFVDVGEVVQLALTNLTSAIEEADAQLEVHPLPTVQGDQHQLVRLFQNLIGNAIKFRDASRPRIEISAEQTTDAWQFAVQDNGIGLKPEFAERIFVVFQRLHSRKEYPGTGMGLAICQRIVERHGGSIWVEAVEGQGCRFVFTLPLEPHAGQSAR